MNPTGASLDGDQTFPAVDDDREGTTQAVTPSVIESDMTSVSIPEGSESRESRAHTPSAIPTVSVSSTISETDSVSRFMSPFR